MPQEMKKLVKIYNEIMTKLYAKATPKITWQQYKKKYDKTKLRGYENYYVPNKVQTKIYDEIIKKYKLDRREQNMMGMEVWLGCSPSIIKPKRNKK